MSAVAIGLMTVLHCSIGGAKGRAMGDEEDSLGEVRQGGRSASLAELAYDRIEAMSGH
jgi:hypothetical protein